MQESRSLQLLTIYEQRIQRSVDKNTAQLKAIQAERKEQAREAMRQAKLFYQLAEAEGRPYDPESYFSFAPEVRESVFSTPEVTRQIHLAAATHHRACTPQSLPNPQRPPSHAASGPCGSASDGTWH